MADSPEVLLERVRRRQSVVSYFAALRPALWVGGGAYLVAVACQKLFDVLPAATGLLGPFVVLAAALVVAAFVAQRGTAASASRAVDEALGSKDLFLTAAHLDGSTGSYQELVTQRAERSAADADARNIVPLRFSPAAALPLLLLGLVLGLGRFLPTLDLLGRGEQRRVAEERGAEREAERKELEERVAKLAELPLAEPHSPAVEQELRELEKTFAALRKETPEANRDALKERQREASDLWRQREERMPSSERRMQSLGLSPRMAEVQKDLGRGKTDSAKESLAEVKKLAQALKSEQDPAKKEELRKELDKALGELERAASGAMPNSALADALSQALQQLRTSDSAESLDGLDSALELSALSLDQLAQALRDLAALEEALKALQDASQLDAQNPLDGPACSCSSIGDYAKLFAQMTANQGGQHVCSQCQGTGAKEGMP